MNDRRQRWIWIVLVSLVGLDVSLVTIAAFFPQLWFTLFHGVRYEDPEGFLPRCASNWAAFLLFQVIALWRWKREPEWLAVVAGLRLSDIFTDWTYCFAARDMTPMGRVGLLVMSPVNLAIGLYLLYAYRSILREQRR